MISIDYNLSALMYNEVEGARKTKKTAMNKADIAHQLDIIRQGLFEYRTHFYPGRLALDEDLWADHFLTEEYGLCKIHEESLSFEYSNKKEFLGTLHWHLVLEPLETPVGHPTKEAIEEIIGDSFRPTIDDETGFSRPLYIDRGHYGEWTIINVKSAPADITWELRA